MKKQILAVVAISSLAIASLSMPAYAENVAEVDHPSMTNAYTTPVKTNETDETVTVEDGVSVSPRGVSIVNKSVSLDVGQSYSTSFKMDNFWADPHNTFKIVVSGLTRYNVVVTKSDDSWDYASDIKDVDSTWTIDRCTAGVTYTVTINNIGSKPINGKVSITSYIQ